MCSMSEIPNAPPLFFCTRWGWEAGCGNRISLFLRHITMCWHPISPDVLDRLQLDRLRWRKQLPRWYIFSVLVVTDQRIFVDCRLEQWWHYRSISMHQS